MRSSRSRCALAGAFLLAAAGVFALPVQARAQGGFDRGVVAAADQVVNLIAQSADSRQNRADLGELRSALDQLLNVLEQPRSRQGEQGRNDEHRGHLRHGLASAGHDRRHDDADKDHADKKRSEADDRRADDKAGHKNRIGAMPGQPAQIANAKARPRTASGGGDAGHVKNGAGASAARPGRTLAPVGQDGGQQMNPPGAAKNGAGPGNVQAKNGSGGKFGNNNGNSNQALGNNGGANRFGNAKAGNQANGAPMNNPGNPNGKPWQFGDRKDDHHHHHHFGEARDAGDKRSGQDRQGQAMGGFGNSKNGAGPQANQVRAKNGSGANNAGSFAKNLGNRGNGQAMNMGGQNANAPSRAAGNNQTHNRTATNNNATQAYINQLMNANGSRTGQQTHQSPANNAQRSQGNLGRQQTTQHSASNSMTRSFHGFSNSTQAHAFAGHSVGQHFASQPAHSGKR